MNVDLLIVVVYLLGMLVVGYLLGRGESADGFFVNNRKTKTWLLAFTALSTTVGSGTVIGVAGAAYTTGISFGLSFALASVLGWASVAWLAPRIKQWGDTLNAYTFGDFLAARYAPGSRNIGVLVIIVGYFLAAAIQFVAFASIAEIFAGIDFEIALIGAAFITIGYTFLAGIKGDIYTDAIQIMVMLPVFIFLFIAGFSKIGFGEIFSGLPPELLSPTNYAGPVFFVAAIVFGFILLLVQVEVWQRVFAAMDARSARRAFVFAGVLKVVAIVASTILGLMAFHLVPDVSNADGVLFALMKELLPVGLLGIGLASVLAILMSTTDSVLMVGSATLTKDFYLAKFPTTDERKILLVGRLFIVGFGLGAFVVALSVQDIVQLAVFSVQIIAVFAPALLGGLLWKRATADAAFWSIAVGFVLTLALLPAMPDIAAVPALLVSILIYVGITFWQTRSGNMSNLV